MTRKRTPEEFLLGPKSEHSNFYSYEKVIYTTARSKVTITCPLHGDFDQVAEYHLQGSGCPVCARLGTIKNQKKTQEQFITEVVNVNNEYDYSKVVYVNTKTKVVVGCSKHGDFLSTPQTLLQGHGCPKCAVEKNTDRIRSTTQEFIEKSKLKQEVVYNYEKVNYVNNLTDVEIICPTHGTFWQTPSNHLQGAGCPHCGKSGFNRNKPASLYILRCDNMTKVGITNVSVTKRLKQLSGSSKHAYTIFHSQYFELGENALNLETKTLQYLKGLYKQPEDKFQGSTECFFDVNIEELMQFVSPQSNITELT